MGGLADGAAGVTILVQFDDIDIGLSCAEGFGVAGDDVAAIGGLNEGEAPVMFWSADGFSPLEVTIGIQLDDINIGFCRAEVSSKLIRGGGAGYSVAAIGGLNKGVAYFTRWSADGFGPLEVSIGIQLDHIDIGSSYAEGFGVAGDGIAAIGGLNEGGAPVTLWSADGFGPLEVSIGIQFDDIDILFSCAEGVGVAGDGVAAIGGLNEGVALLILWSADGFGPLEVTIGIQLDGIDIIPSCAEGAGGAGDGVAAIGGLNEGEAYFIAWSADGFGPLEVTLGIQLDDIDIDTSCAEGFGLAGGGVAAIGGLDEGGAPLTRWSADSLTEVGGGASGRDGIRAGGGLSVRILRWRIRAGGGSIARVLH